MESSLILGHPPNVFFFFFTHDRRFQSPVSNSTGKPRRWLQSTTCYNDHRPELYAYCVNDGENLIDYLFEFPSFTSVKDPRCDEISRNVMLGCTYTQEVH